VVVIPLTDTPLCAHTVTDVAVTDGRIHITLERLGASAATGSRFLLVPVAGDLQDAEVSYTLVP
jgi:hypothetical protein